MQDNDNNHHSMNASKDDEDSTGVVVPSSVSVLLKVHRHCGYTDSPPMINSAQNHDSQPSAAPQQPHLNTAHNQDRLSSSRCNQWWHRPSTEHTWTSSSASGGGGGGGSLLQPTSLGEGDESTHMRRRRCGKELFGPDFSSSSGNNNDLEDVESVEGAARKREQSERVQQALDQYRRRQSSSSLLSWPKKRHILNLQSLQLYGLDHEAVEQMHQLQIQHLTLSHNDAMVIVPPALVQFQSTAVPSSTNVQGPTMASPSPSIAPPSSSLLVSLRHLELGHCSITLWSEPWELPNLQTLDLQHNRLRDFPSKLALKGIPQLRELNLSHNRILRLPDWDRLESDPILNNNNNNNSNYKNTLHRGRRRSFQTLAAALEKRDTTNTNKDDKKEDGGDDLNPENRHEENENDDCGYDYYLKHLIKLNLSYNDLTYLPERLPRRLQVLRVANNFISHIPPLLVTQSATHLQELQVRGNPMADPPVAICEAGLRAMQHYWKQQQEQHQAAAQSQPAVTQSSSARWRSLFHSQKSSKTSSRRKLGGSNASSLFAQRMTTEPQTPQPVTNEAVVAEPSLHPLFRGSGRITIPHPATERPPASITVRPSSSLSLPVTTATRTTARPLELTVPPVIEIRTTPAL